MSNVTELKRGPDGISKSRPLAVFSCDSHCGPRLSEDLAQYCPPKYKAEFETYAATRAKTMVKRMVGNPFASDDPQANRIMDLLMRNQRTAGHYDMNARLKDMDADGVVCEIIYHTSNGQPIPFLTGLGSDINYEPAKENLELAAVGMHMYNQWLADACSAAPDRLLGAAVLPMWDPQAAAAEAEWAARAGFKGIAFTVMREGIPPYDYEEWERLWSVCSEHGLVLCGHGGGAIPDQRGKAYDFSIGMAEQGSWLPRRCMPRMIFSGVFERHPKLKLILAEQNPDWWMNARNEYDSIYLNQHWQLKQFMSMKPSEYMDRQIFIGDSFMAPFEAADAVKNNYVPNMLWGRDYPHAEGTYVFQESGNEKPETNPSRLSMRFCFSDIEPANIAKMVSQTGVEIFGLDAAKVQAIADSIGAPSINELKTPIAAVPQPAGYLAFRSLGWSA